MRTRITWSVALGVCLVVLVGLAAGGALAQTVDRPTEVPAAATPATASADRIETLTTRADDLKLALDTLWVMVAAFLVFFMNLGFAAVESGFCRAKNTVAILAKNFVVFAVSSIAFLVLGFGMGLTFLVLGDNLRDINRNDRHEVIGTLGISMSY